MGQFSLTTILRYGGATPMKGAIVATKRTHASFLVIMSASIILVVGVALAVFVNAFLASTATLQRTESTLVESARLQAQTFETVCADKFEALEEIAESVASFDRLDDVPASAAYLSLVATGSSFSRVFVDLPDGSAFSDDGLQTQVADRAYFQQALEGDSTVTKVDSARISGDQRLIFAVPVMQGNDVVAAMHGSFDQQAIRKLLTTNAYGGEGYSFVCDASGRIILQSESANALFTGDADLLTFLENATLGSGYTLDRLRAAMAGGSSGFFSYEADGQERYAVFTPLELNTSDGTQWFVFNVVPAQIISGEITALANDSLILIAILMVTCALVIALILFNAHREKAQRDAENELLHKQEQRYRIVVERSNKNIYCYDIATRATHRDRAPADNFGYPVTIENVPESQMRGDLIAEESKAEYLAFFERIRAGESPVSMLTRMRDVDGNLRWFRSESSTIFGTDGKPLEAIVAYWDVTDEHERELAYQRQADEQVKLQARLGVDPLTGVLNRQAFEEQAEALLRSSVPPVQHAFIMIDIDEFKSINDNFGHIKGDEALRGVAESVRGLLREHDLVGRLGGDEFMVCLEGIPDDAMVERRVKHICENLHVDLDEEIQTSASLGVALYPRDGQTFLDLYHHADIAMYQAKKTGRDQYLFYDPAKHEGEDPDVITPIDSPE